MLIPMVVFFYKSNSLLTIFKWALKTYFKILKIAVIVSLVLSFFTFLFLLNKGAFKLDEMENFYCDERRQVYKVELYGVYKGSELKPVKGRTQVFANLSLEASLYHFIDPTEEFFDLRGLL